MLPDGTSLLVDAGAAPDGIPYATARPDDSRSPGEWIARYVRRVLDYQTEPSLDYVLITHFHSDHMGGLVDVAARIPIRKLIDRGWPDYDYPVALDSEYIKRYRGLGLDTEAFRAGPRDQLVMTRDPDAYPDLEIRNLTGNGNVWTGEGDAARPHFPPLETLAREDYPSENMCSLSFRLRYGAFDYYTGGDLTGIPNVGHPDWQHMEKALAAVMDPVDIHVVNHHGSIDPASPEFLAALEPRVHIIPSWSATHPAPSVLKRMLSERAYPGPRDVFAVRFLEPTRAAIGPRAERVKSGGHIVVRVTDRGAKYRVFIVDDADERGDVLTEHGPYISQ